jgi:glutamate--cysteine ligase
VANQNGRGEESPLATEDLCHAWISEKTFRLQPDDYKKRCPGRPGAVGIEIEMLPLDPREQDRPQRVTLQPPSDPKSLTHALIELSRKRGWNLEYVEHSEALLKVLLEERDNLSFEPGGQLEFSSRPYDCLGSVQQRTIEIQKDIDSFIANYGFKLLQVGLNPWHSIQEIGLQMQKPRYEAMDKFFSNIGPYGPRMMRQTCTVQVNLDFGPDESTMAKRFLCSLLLSPFGGATFCYAPFESGKPNGYKSLRQKVWRELDSTRTGLPNLSQLEKRLDKKACVETYLDFANSARVVFVEALGFKAQLKNTPWKEWLHHPIEGIKPTMADFETHLSLLFAEVRPRGFLEVRSIDCQPRVWQFVPACWYAGLLYDNKALDSALELLLPHRKNIGNLLESACHGLQDPMLQKLSAQLHQLAIEGLVRLPECYGGSGNVELLEKFGRHFVARGRTPADDVLDEFTRQGHSDISLKVFEAVEQKWRNEVLGG